MLAWKNLEQELLLRASPPDFGERFFSLSSSFKNVFPNLILFTLKSYIWDFQSTKISNTKSHQNRHYTNTWQH